jgi:hypothetical protein
MTPERYAQILTEFDAVGSYATEVSGRLVGITPTESYLSYGEQIFVKLLAHCISIRRLSPDPAGAESQEVWDLSSTATIARAVIESFDALAYIALAKISGQQRAFRVLLWELHDVNRRTKMLKYIGSTNPNRAQLEGQDNELTKKLIQHPCFSTLSNNLQQKVKNGDPPQFANSQRQRCLEGRIDFDYYTAVTMQLSQYAHTSPYAVHQLFKFRAGQSEERQLMSLPIQYSLVFLVRAVAGMQSLFPAARLPMSDTLKASFEIWTLISEKGVRNVS